MSEKSEPTLEDVIGFLLGEHPLVDGINFGERHPDHKGAFWWRSYLRRAWNRRAPEPEQSDVERAEAFLCGHDLDEKYPAHFGIMRQTLAALLAAVRAEERERCAERIKTEQAFIERATTPDMNSRYGLTNEDTIHSAWMKVVGYFAEAIRKGEP